MFLDILLYESKYTRISVFYPLGVDYTENIGIMKENSDYFGEIQMSVDVGFTRSRRHISGCRCNPNLIQASPTSKQHSLPGFLPSSIP